MKITVLGMGLMGLPIGLRLKECGHELVGWNRSEQRLQAAEEAGLPVEADLQQAMTQGEVIILTLSDAGVIRQLLFQSGADEQIEGRKILQMGTIGPEESRELGRMVSEAGGEYLEAPVLGSRPEASSGKLIIMAAGPEPLFQHCLPVLQCLGKEVEHVGGLGKGAAMKLAMNQLIASLTAGFSLSLGLIRAEEVELSQFMALLRESALYAPTFDKKLNKMLDHNYANPNFPLKHLIKDVSLFRQVAEQKGLDTLLLESMQQLFEKGMAAHADDDYSALYESINPAKDLGVDEGC
jgi:3-hydroxyisobutyrate dehydrogenase-like beta-hydroxyacid dehydrogenase